MKTNKTLITLLLMCTSFVYLNETKAQSVNVDVNFSVFQEELSPYGRWENNPRFGEVWVYGDPNFKPYYTDGHWEYTNYGWSWVSDFDWGWAPFHYGRWEYDSFDGWMWIPGYEWASAWVSWSSCDDYYGWAPLGFGVGINVSFGSIPYDRWSFIPRSNICEREVSRYCVSPGRNYNFRNAVVINNYYEGREGRFMRGPDRAEVQRYTHNRIEERSINRGRPDNVAYNNRRNSGNNNRPDRNDEQRRPTDNNRQWGQNSNPYSNQNNRPGRNDEQRRPTDNNRQWGQNNNPNANQNNSPNRNDEQRRPTDNNRQWGQNNNPNANQNARPDRNDEQQRRPNDNNRQWNQNNTPPNNSPGNGRWNRGNNPNPNANDNQRRQVERRPDNFPGTNQEQRSQPRFERPQNNNGSGQGRQRGNDNNDSQRGNHGNRKFGK